VGGYCSAWPTAGSVELRGGPAPAQDPFPVQGHCWPTTAGTLMGCLRASPGDAHALWQPVVVVLREMPVADCVRVSPLQCGSFVNV
jgi:hypothetical protein